MPKRKRTVLSMQDKFKIIERFKNGDSATKLAQEYGVGKSTISGLQKQKAAIESFVINLDSSDGSSKRKTMKLAQNTKLDDAVYKWFLQKRSSGEPISGPMLCEKAMEINQKTDGPSTFRASTGWLSRFKSRHGISIIEVEKMSAHNTAAECFKDMFRELIAEGGYSKDNIYNADETVLNWKTLPRKIINSLGESAAAVTDYKDSEERITLVICANASGNHRLPILAIGKSKKPTCFKDVNMNSVPVKYSSQENAWVDSALFINWFSKLFVPAIKKYQLTKSNRREKVLLLLDDDSSHPPSDVLNKIDEFIQVLYLPLNISSLCQPMDRGIIKAFKQLYRKELLEKFFLNNEAEESVINMYKKMDLKDAFCIIYSLWNELENAIVEKAWIKLFLPKNKSSDETSLTNKSYIEKIIVEPTSEFSNCVKEEVTNWFHDENTDLGFQAVNEDEIELHRDTETYISNTNDEVAVKHESSPNIPTHSEALSCLDKVLLWFEVQDESDAIQLNLLKRVRDLAARKHKCALKKGEFDNFFKIRIKETLTSS